MKLVIKRTYHLSNVDYKFIREQIKAKKIKMQDVAKMIGQSRTYLYDQLKGNCPCSIDLLTWLDIHEIKTYYEGEYIE